MASGPWDLNAASTKRGSVTTWLFILSSLSRDMGNTYEHWFYIRILLGSRALLGDCTDGAMVGLVQCG